MTPWHLFLTRLWLAGRRGHPTVAQVAGRLGLARATVASWRSDRIPPDASIVALARVLGWDEATEREGVEAARRSREG